MITTYSPKDYDIFIALDVDKKSFAFTARDHDTMNKSKKVPDSPEQFYNYIRNVYENKRVICAYEAGPTGFGLYDYLTAHNVPCVMASPLSIPKPPNRMVKTNRIDSQQIAQHLKSGDLKPIRVPEGEWRELRHLVAIRSNYARDRKRAKQRIKALLLQENLYPQLCEIKSEWSHRHIIELRAISCSYWENGEKMGSKRWGQTSKCEMI